MVIKKGKVDYLISGRNENLVLGVGLEKIRKGREYVFGSGVIIL